MKNVLLLRTPTEDGPDRYEASLEDRGYVALSVPVLETVFVHIDALRDKIVRGPDTQGLSGVIVTSRRAVEAWSAAIRAIPPSAVQADWRTVSFYVVGDATAAAASHISTALPHLAPGEGRVRGGAETGTAERLAAFILAEECRGQRMLYLTGDKNRETLPEMLSAAGVELETLEVYRTTGSSTFRDDLRAALERASPGESHLAGGATNWGWVVHFAPSAAAFVTPILSEMLNSDAVKVAAIGPTTAAFLRDTLKIGVDVVAPRPTPDALCNSVVDFDAICCQ